MTTPMKSDRERIAAVYDSEGDRTRMLAMASTQLKSWDWPDWPHDMRPLRDRALLQLEKLATEPTARDEQLLAEAAFIRDDSDRVARLNGRDADVRRSCYYQKSLAEAVVAIASASGIEYHVLGCHWVRDYERVFGS